MKTCDEMVNSLLKRREQFLIEQKQKRRKTAVKIAVSGCYCALAAVIGTGIWHSVISSNRETILLENSSVMSENSLSSNSEPEKITPPELDLSAVIWAGSDADDEEAVRGLIVDMVIDAFDEFNGKTITKTLSGAFKEHDEDSVFAAAVFYFPYEYDKNFVYNGKTLAEYDEDVWEKWVRSTNLGYIRNNAEYLKYGEEYYMTNTVVIDGVPWTKDYYDRAVELVGKEFISEYFVDGEFLEDEFTRVYDKAREEYRASEDAYSEAHNAWKTLRLEKETERLKALGIKCKLRNSVDSFIAFVTKDEFSALTFDDSGHWIFGLAQEDESDVIGWLVND